MINSVTFIGSGNVAYHLGHAFLKKNIRIHEVTSRNQQHARLLANSLGAKACESIKHLSQDVDLMVVAVNDDAIEEVLKSIPGSTVNVVHTSGMTGMEVFQSTTLKHSGVFYPVQSFSEKKQEDFSSIPICIESSTVHFKSQLIELAKKLSEFVYELTSEDRQVVHLAAVFANNFSNYLYVIAEEMLRRNKLPTQIVKPLILKTAEKVSRQSAAEVQTGPAIRGDIKTMEAHLKLIPDETLKNIYQLFSLQIQNHLKK